MLRLPQFEQLQDRGDNSANALPAMNDHLPKLADVHACYCLRLRAAAVQEQQMAIDSVSVVLAHGAWADGSSWARVIAALNAEAVKVCAAPLPLTSLADDVAALNRSLDRTEGSIVLAGHAYAGAVIALAHPGRVNVTGLAPDEGEKVADVFFRL